MIAYLDNSATTRPSEGVISAMTRAMREGYFNPSSLYAPAMASEKEMNECREKLAKSVRMPGARVVFTSGGTEANNLAVIGISRALRSAKRVAISATEHPSITQAAEALAEYGYETVKIGVDRNGALDLAQLRAELQKGLALVCCMQVNNETGAVLDLNAVSTLVRGESPDTLIHVDGVQGFLRVPFDLRLCDSYALSAHKLHGPKGVGALITRANLRLRARQLGGGQEKELRSGTENTPGIAGLSAAVDEFAQMDDAPARMRAVKQTLMDALMAGIPNLTVNGPAPDKGAPHIVNLSFPGVRGEVMLHALEANGVYVSTGSACSSKKRKLSPVLLSMGIKPEVAECALRFSFSPYTTREEALYAADVCVKQYEILKRYQRR